MSEKKENYFSKMKNDGTAGSIAMKLREMIDITFKKNVPEEMNSKVTVVHEIVIFIFKNKECQLWNCCFDCDETS